MENFERFKSKQISSQESRSVTGGTECSECIGIADQFCGHLQGNPGYFECWYGVFLECYRSCGPDTQ